MIASRPRRLLRLAVPIVALLLLVAAHEVWDYLEGSWLKATIDRIPPATLVEPNLAPPAAPRDLAHDAAPYFLAASRLVEGDPALGRPATDLEGALASGHVSGDVLGQERALLASSDALRLFDQAVARPFAGYHPDRPGNAHEVSQLARLDGLRALVAGLDGDGATAAASVTTAIAVAGDPHGPMAGDFVFPHFAETIADLQVVLTGSKPPTDNEFAKLATALTLADQDDVLARRYEDLRRNVLQFVANRYFGSLDYATWGHVGLLADDPLSLLDRLSRPVNARRIRLALEHLASLVEAAQRPWPERITAIAKAEATRGVSESITIQTLDWDVTDLAMVRVASVVVAIERYRRVHAGLVPVSLSDLAPTLLTTVPTDPFSGQSLHFKLLPSGYVVYSVGPDGQDDGGLLTGLEPFARRRSTAGAVTPPTPDDLGLRILK